MKTHSDILTSADVEAACVRARARGYDIHIDVAVDCGSRKRAHGVTIYCESYNGRRARNGREGLAASWTAYGYLFAEMFTRDPNAVIGQYDGVRGFAERCASYVPKGENLGFLKLLDSGAVQGLPIF